MAKETGAAIKAIRQLMDKNKLRVYLVPSEDAHQSEYIADRDGRRAWLTGFTGSRGLAAVSTNDAAMWTDGRYFLQARREMDLNWELMRERMEGTPSLTEWVVRQAGADGRVGVDPFLYSAAGYRSLARELAAQSVQLVSIQPNLVDELWKNQPEHPKEAIRVLPTSATGLSWKDKLQKLREEMKKKKASALLITALDEVAWTLNLRGADIAYNPVFFAYILLTNSHCHLYLDIEGRGDAVKQFLADAGDKITLHPYSAVLNHFKGELKSLLQLPSHKIWLPGSTSFALAEAVPETRTVGDTSPVAVLKSIKNQVEMAGMARAHVKDAVAHVEFLVWLEKEMERGTALTELDISDKFLKLREAQEGYVSLSFTTISASGPHAANCHYSVDKESNRALSLDEVFLVDSGGQYLDGTTDVTRTVAFVPTPPEFVREAYTRVLKGHIRLARLNFPNGTSGAQLDTVSRIDLWEAGLEFRHGTGHGVGHFLNVHEGNYETLGGRQGPMGMGQRDPVAAREGIKESMVLTIEPGYYHDGEFGIRIENVYAIVKADTAHRYQGMDYLTFKPLTLVPMATNLILPSLLRPDEVEWLNAYHAQVEAQIGAELEAQGKSEILPWLHNACKPIG